MDGDGVTREGALHLQLGSRGVTRGRSDSMLATSPAAAALTAHHHPAQGKMPRVDKTETVKQKQYTVNNLRNNKTLLDHCYKTSVRGRREKDCSANQQMCLILEIPTQSPCTHTFTVHRIEKKKTLQLSIHPNMSRLDRYVHAPLSISRQYARL